MPNPYSKVEVTEEDLQDYKLTLEEPTDVTPQEQYDASDGAEESANISDEIDLNDYELVIGDDVFSYDDIQTWREAADNQTNWQQSNTQKAQELAPMRKLFNALNENETLRGHIKDFYEDDVDTYNSFGLDNRYAVDSIPEQQEQSANPEYEELNERLSVFEEEKGIQELEHGLDDIIRDNQNFFESDDDELDFLDYMIENGMQDFDQAFKMWSYPRMQEQLESFNKMKGNVERNKGVVQTTENGAKEVQQPQRFNSYKEISAGHPDIAKYGNLTE